MGVENKKLNPLPNKTPTPSTLKKLIKNIHTFHFKKITPSQSPL